MKTSGGEPTKRKKSLLIVAILLLVAPIILFLSFLFVNCSVLSNDCSEGGGGAYIWSFVPILFISFLVSVVLFVNYFSSDSVSSKAQQEAPVAPQTKRKNGTPTLVLALILLFVILCPFLFLMFGWDAIYHHTAGLQGLAFIILIILGVSYFSSKR